jgi:isochorismate synthase EntC
MTGSPSYLSNWADRDFWNLGAFLISPDGENVTLGKGGSCTITEKLTEAPIPVFYLKDFYSGAYLTYTPAEFLTISRGNLLDWMNHFQENHPPISPVSNDDDVYERDFALLKSSFKSGLEKVVLISRETYFSFEGEVTIQHLMKKAFHFGTGSPYGFWNGHYGVIGSTPEVLFSIHDKSLKTFALAGTARKGQEEELLLSEKDRHEHNLVIRDITEKLSPFTTDLKVAPTGVHPFKSIIHLKTDIMGKLRENIDYTALTNSLSPTAALGGYPKNSSLCFLKSSHYSARYPVRYFGSAFGIMSQEMKHFVVSIRNVQWENKHLFIESGGGIVPESEFAKELEEIHLKRQTIRSHYL